MLTTLVPDDFINEYNLHDNIIDRYLYVKIIRGMYVQPQAICLANKLLKQQLSKYGYYEIYVTPGL